MPVILLIGGAGFIGVHVAERLAAEGHSVVVLDSLSYYHSPLSQLEAASVAQRLRRLRAVATVIRGDASQGSALADVFRRYAPTRILHLGGAPLLSFANRNISEAHNSILASTMCLLQAVQNMPDLERLVYVSSSTVYGDFGKPSVDETHLAKPKGVYAGAKLASEILIQAHARQFGLPFVIVRPSAVYGPTDINRRVTQLFMENALLNRPLIVNDPGTALDFTYVEDIAAGLTLALLHPAAVGHVFNITRGEGRTLAEFVELLRRWVPNLQTDLKEADPEVPKRGALSTAAAAQVLGYESQFSLEAGVELYFRHLSDQMKELGVHAN